MADLERVPERGGGRPPPADRHRRRLLDGRLPRRPARRSATSPTGTTRSSWSTTRTRSGSSARAAAARRSTSASSTASTSSPARSARRSAARRGGYASGRREIVEILRQRSRPYLFSNSLAPPIVGAALATVDLLESSDDLRTRLAENTAWFRGRMVDAGFDLLPGEHPIVPVMFGDAVAAGRFARRPARPRRLRRRLLVPGRAAGQGPHPHAAVGGAQPRRPRGRRRSVRGGPAGTPVHSGQRTIMTGQGACSDTRSAVDPRSRSRTKWPRWPSTTRS